MTKSRTSEIAIGDSNGKLLELSPIQIEKGTGSKFRSLKWSDEAAKAVSEIKGRIGKIESIRRKLLDSDLAQIRRDIEKLRSVSGAREAELARLREIYQQERSTICNLLPTESLDIALLDSGEIMQLPDTLTKDVDKLEKRFQEREAKIQKLDAALEKLLTQRDDSDPRKLFESLRDQALLPSQSILAEFAEDVLALQVLQARARIESVVLPPVDLMPEEAIEIARTNRLDWMNTQRWSRGFLAGHRGCRR